MIKVHQLALLKDGKMEDYINHINQVSNKIDLVMEIMNTSKLEEISVLTIIDQIGQLHLEVSETEATTHFHSRQNTTDIRIPMLQEQYYKVKEKLNLLYNKLDHFLLNLPQSCLEKILKDNIVGSQTFYLQERLEMAKSQLPSTLDSMARNGLRSWTCLRQTMIQRVKFSLTMDGTDKMITGPQAIHLMFTSHPDKKVRHELHHKFEEALQPDLDLFAIAMNEITNIHLKIQESRGNMNQPLSETLKMNRISKHSLVSMEKAIDENLSRFVPYFHRKAELLGMNNFGEKDLIATIGNPKLNVPFKEAIVWIQEMFAQFSPSMAEFVQTVISNQWIDEEIRPDKSYIQNCTYFPKSKQSRINMRYKGTFHCISTLAHELGHGYHYHHLSNQPAFSQFTPLSMAEIASTFAEMLVTKCMIDRVKSVEEKIILLDEKIKNTITYLLKPYANFLFQKKLYEECRRGSITASRLNEFMIEAQKFVYRESLSQYTPITWISNNLFYIPTNPFYNYQYSLGYLFSAGIHAQIQKNQFSSHQYDAFLQDTGCMNLENLAEKHFNIELGSLTFWQGSLDLLLSDIDLFLELTNFINPSKLF